MRYLVLSDIHGHHMTLEKIVNSITVRDSRFDAVLIAGDLTNFGTMANAAILVGILREKLPAVPLAAVAGNCDPSDVRSYLEATDISVESRMVARGGLLVSGAGGGLLHHGNMPFERVEADFSRAFRDAFAGFTDHTASGLPFVGLTHTPPYGGEADLRNHRHTGSKVILQQLLRRKAVAWICGHIHESRSVSEVDTTLVVNPGPAAEGCHAIMEIAPDGRGGWRSEAKLLGL